MRLTKQITSLLLALLMLLTILPAGAEMFGSAPSEPQMPVSEPEVSKTVFSAGLATLGSGAKVYDRMNLSGSFETTAERGVVYALELSDDENAVRICLYTGEKLHHGWVAKSALSMLSATEAAVNQVRLKGQSGVREYRGKLLDVVRLKGMETADPTRAPVQQTQAPTQAPTAAPTAVPTQAPVNGEMFGSAPADPTAAPVPDDANGSGESSSGNTGNAPAQGPGADLIEADKLLPVRSLSTPANLRASHNRVGLLTLSWNAVDGADGYQILYKENGESDYRQLAVARDTQYKTDDLDPTVVYYFKVCAVELSSSGEIINYGPSGPSIPYIVLGDVKINDPRGKDSSTIRLTWNAVGGATHYDVMMAEHGLGNWRIVRTDLTTDYCDIKNLSFNETYDFKVIPKRKMSNGMVLTGNDSRVAMVGSPMETPSFQSYTWTPSGLQLTWDAIPGATGYVIYRRAFSDPDVNNYTKLVVLDEPVTTYTDTSMFSGEVYYYFVYSFRLCSPEGWRCFSLKGDIGMGVWMNAPQNLQPTGTASSGVYLKWNPVPGASHYDVYIGTTPNQNPGNGNGRVTTSDGYHNTAALGQTYYYRVRGVRQFSNGDISYSPWSDEYAYTYTAGEPVYRALLIGNTYPGEADYLPGPDNDANGMATMLRRMTGTRYSTTVKLNQTDSGMINAINSTFAGATANDVSLFYYSGHGVNDDYGAWHGALCGVSNTYLSINRLKQALDTIPGRKIVILDSCHSGQAIGKSSGETVDVGASSAQLNAFNSAVVSAFSSQSKSASTVNYAELPAAEHTFVSEEIAMITRGANDLANSGYYVITAAHSSERSVSSGFDGNGDEQADKYFGLFTYSLCHGSGWNLARNTGISTLNADTDNNQELTLYEVYRYARALALQQNPGQTAQIYPANSGLVVWSK